MPRRCSGSFSEETIRQIRKQQSGYVPVLMGICEKCGRNVVAENKGANGCLQATSRCRDDAEGAASARATSGEMVQRGIG